MGTHMLIQEEDGNVLPLLREIVKRLLNGRHLGLRVDDQEVFLSVRRLSDVLRRCWSV